MTTTVHKRTFTALKFPKGSPERDALNTNPLTSEYFPSQRYAIQRPALMSDGSPNPTQKFWVNTFKTKAEAMDAAIHWNSQIT